MKYYIPRRVQLPFGYTVKIKQLRKKAWKKAYTEAFADGDHSGTAAFSFQQGDNTAIIILQKNRTPQERKEDLVHELQHVMIEYQEYVKTISPCVA